MGSLPDVILWEITYACPLRCQHCYSESGRRPARQLASHDLMRLTTRLTEMQPRVVHIGGGEPLLIRELIPIAERLASAGVQVVLSTSGFNLTDELASQISDGFHSVHISIDGPDAAIHDRIRGREGSFEAATTALERFDSLSRERRLKARAPLQFGIDCTLVRCNFSSIRRMLTELVPQVPELGFILFNAAIPNGCASREEYEPELLDDAQLARLADPQFAAELQQLAPPGVAVSLTDNTDLQMHPDRVRDGTAAVDFMAVEPDGQVRALPIYEGVVGSLLEEAPTDLWSRVKERRSHPYVIEQLSKIRGMHDWAVATRNLNQRFASVMDLARIRARHQLSSTD